MLFAGVAIILAAVYLLIKRYESRMILIGAGLLMTALAGTPLAAFQAFSQSMVTKELIQTICPVMGFAYVMQATKCDKHLISLVAKALQKVRPVLIPGAVLGTFAINISLPSAAGTGAAVGAIFIPLLISSGVHPATAAAAVLAGTFGSNLSPGLPHNPFVAKLANTDVLTVISVHALTDIVCGLIAAFGLLLVDKFLAKRALDNSYLETGDALMPDSLSDEKANLLYAIVPVVPVVLLVLGATNAVPALAKLEVAHSMLIGCLLGILVTRQNPGKITKEFFKGLGDAYGDILGIIIAAYVFVAGMESLGLVKALIAAMVDSSAWAKYAAVFGPFLLAVISGTGNAAAFAFNQAVTPNAAQFGMDIVNMGSLATLGGVLGRTMSPIAGVTIVCASLAGASPFEVAKRNTPAMLVAAGATIVMLT